MRKALSLLALLAFLLTQGVATADAKAKRLPKVPRSWVGVMADGPLTAAGSRFGGEFKRIRRSGASFVRVPFFWSQLQPAADRLDWSASDAVVGAAAKQGLDVIPVVVDTPNWAASALDVAGSSPRDTVNYPAFMSQLVNRYGPKGAFWAARRDVRKRPVRNWQIWNEPDLLQFWVDQPFAARYVALLRAAHVAIKAADPGAKVVLSAFPNKSWVGLEQVYRAGGKRYFDVATFNVFTAKPAGVPVVLAHDRRVMRRYGDGRKPIWASELAWTTGGADAGAGVTWRVSPRVQGKRVQQVLEVLARKRKALKLQRVTWYTWLSRPNPRTWTTYTSLRRLKGNRVVTMPALKGFTRVVRRLR